MITISVDEQLLGEAIAKWGWQAQVDMAKEEMAELIVALSHFNRGRDCNVVEKIADVIIMAMQLSKIFGSDEVNNEVVKKLARLKEKLNQPHFSIGFLKHCEKIDGNHSED